MPVSIDLRPRGRARRRDVAGRRLAALLVTAAVLAGGCSAAPDAAGNPTAAGEPAGAPTSPTTTPSSGAGRLGTGPKATPGPTPPPKPPAGGCQIMPSNSFWRTEVTRLPVHRGSAAFVGSIGAGKSLKADFGAGQWDGGPIGIPVTTIPAGQAGVAVSFEVPEESDRGRYPVPRNAKIEGGPNSDGDRHVIVYDPARCRVYELYSAFPRGDGSWRAFSGAIFDLRSNKLRRAGWTSADAAGLPILPGLVRYEEVAAGRIDHAIRITVPRTRTGFLWPATHSASSATDPALPQLGLRLRLKAGVNLTRLPRQARVIAEAMRRYGVIVADHGSAWFVSGAPDERWNNDALRALATLKGTDFEAVDTTSMIITRDSGAARRP